MWGFSVRQRRLPVPVAVPLRAGGRPDHGRAPQPPRQRAARPVRTSIMFPGQADVTVNGVPVSRSSYAAATRRRHLPRSCRPSATADSITYSFTAAHAGTYLYESGTSTARPAADGPVRRPDRPAAARRRRRAPALRRASRRPSTTRSARSSTCSPTSTPTCTSRSTRAGRTPRRASARATGSSTAAASRTPPPRTSRTGFRPAVRLEPPRAADRTPAAPRRRGLAGRLRHVPRRVRYLNASETAHPFHPHSADTLRARHRRRAARVVDRRRPDREPLLDRDRARARPWTPRGARSTSAPTRRGVNCRSTRPPTRCRCPCRTSATPAGRRPRRPPARRTSGSRTTCRTASRRLNECGEYYSVSHSHAVEEATTYGAAGGGMLTLYRIDPPGHEGCTP